ncbi:MAG: peptidase S8 [Lachnospiraceae bacterium]|nr:peptidase S8 [Lachnospiraceae bacterium]
MKNVRTVLEIDCVHNNGVTGENIGVAILDTGIFLHDDFLKPFYRVVAFKDFVNKKVEPYDDNGHGTHVAGICGGSGYSSKGIYKGVAPKCNLIIEKVLDSYGIGSVEYVEEALLWTIDNMKKYGIHIVNLSIGSYGGNSSDINRLLDVVEYAWDKGLVVLTAAGNKGPKAGSITEPGTCKKIITVGTMEEYIYFTRNGKSVRGFSGCGPTKENIVKPEVVAPGCNIISCNNGKGYVSKSGTSMATPVVSGIVALGLEAFYKKPFYEKDNHNKENYDKGYIYHKNILIRKNNINKQIKKALFETSYDLRKEKNKQGWGLINAQGMVRNISKY